MENSDVKNIKTELLSSSDGEDDAEMLCVKKCLQKYVNTIRLELSNETNKNKISKSSPNSGDSSVAVGSDDIMSLLSGSKTGEGVAATGSSLRENRLTNIIEQLRTNTKQKGRDSAVKFGRNMTSKDFGGGGSDQGGGGGGGGTAKVRSHRRRGPSSNNHSSSNGPSLEISAAHHNNNNNIGSPLHAAGIKSESSLSPHYNTPEWSSSRSRSVTPSSCSFPGTPPQSAADRGPSPAHPAQSGHMGQSGTLGSSQTPGPLGHTSVPGQAPHALRNYSDFMRSLAAKYNNANNNDFFRASLTNGLEPLGTLKPPPLGSLLPPHPAPPPAPAPSPQTPVGGIFANYSFSQGGPKTVSAFPSMLDMSSTKALLAIAKVANATKETNSYGKGVKRSPNKDSNPLTSPLDLSSAASVFSSSAKKSRTSPKHDSESGSFSSSSGERERSPGMDIRNLSIKTEVRNGSIDNNMKLNCGRSDAGSPASSGRKSPSSTGRKSPLGPSCNSSSCCRLEKKDCSAGSQEVAAWTVDDVCKFVESIDICSEYSPIFREQSIDGAGLPLLTEDHLTGLLKMKLGPALKLRALLAAKMGGCNHCKTHHPSSGPTTYPAKIERPPSAASDES